MAIFNSKRIGAILPDVEIRKIPGWDNYGVTDDGRVWSFRSNRFMSQKLNHNGYCVVGLCRNDKQIYFLVSRAVAICWLPNDVNRICFNHIDGLKTNNKASNLEWCTRKENMDHAWRTGLMKNSVTGGAKLNVQQVLEIRSSKERGTYLSKKYEISASIISQIRSGQIWRHV